MGASIGDDTLAPLAHEVGSRVFVLAVEKHLEAEPDRGWKYPIKGLRERCKWAEKDLAAEAASPSRSAPRPALNSPTPPAPQQPAKRTERMWACEQAHPRHIGQVARGEVVDDDVRAQVDAAEVRCLEPDDRRWRKPFRELSDEDRVEFLAPYTVQPLPDPKHEEMRRHRARIAANLARGNMHAEAPR